MMVFTSPITTVRTGNHQIIYLFRYCLVTKALQWENKRVIYQYHLELESMGNVYISACIIIHYTLQQQKITELWTCKE